MTVVVPCCGEEKRLLGFLYNIFSLKNVMKGVENRDFVIDGAFEVD